jgi:hypothetical protein
VPIFAFDVFDPTTAHVGTPFKHVAMCVGMCSKTVAGAGRNCPSRGSAPDLLSSLWDELDRGWDQALFTNFSWSAVAHLKLPSHDVSEYGRRMEESEEGLVKMLLNDLYARKDLVGNLVADF